MHSRNAFSCGSNFLVKERETVTGPGIHLSCSSTSTPSSTYARNVNTSIRGTHELFFYTACIVFAPRKRLCGSCSVNRGSLGGLVLVCRGSEAVDVFRSSDLQRGAVTDLLLQNWGASMSEVNAWCVEYPIEELQNVLEPFHSFHQNFNGVEGGVVECLRKSPMETVEHLNNLNLLYEYGISSSDMLVLLRRFPRLLILQKATILTSLKTLNELGITQEVGCRLLLVVPQILARPTCFSESIRFLHAIGLSRGDTSDLVSRFPNVLVLRKRTCLQPKWRFLTEVMGRGIQDVIAWPAFFGVSLENRIIPQWEQAKADNTTHLSIRSLFGGKSKPSSAGTAAAAAAAAGSRLPKLDESSDKVREFLQEELGLTDAEIIKMMQRWAPLANLSVVHKLEPSLDYLMHTLHWTKERLRRAVCAYPPLLALTAGSRDVVAFVLHLGVPEDKLSCIHPRMLQAHPATVGYAADFLMERTEGGLFTREGLVESVSSSGQALTVTLQTLRPKVAFVRKYIDSEFRAMSSSTKDRLLLSSQETLWWRHRLLVSNGMYPYPPHYLYCTLKLLLDRTGLADSEVAQFMPQDKA